MRFVLFKGQSRYGSLRLRADQLSAALAGAGHDAQTLDLVAPDANALLKASFEPRPDCYFGFGGVGSDIRANGALALRPAGDGLCDPARGPSGASHRAPVEPDRQECRLRARPQPQGLPGGVAGRGAPDPGGVHAARRQLQLAEPVD